MEIPKVFISYSHDSQVHKQWVLQLVIRLRNNGIDAIIDQFELSLGDDLPHFMETNLATADKIIMVCTDTYVKKANLGEGGVGYEKMIITSNLLKKINENKIIPIVRQSSVTELPTFLKTKLYINFSTDGEYEFNYDNLVRSIHKAPLYIKPPVGNNPFLTVNETPISPYKSLLDELLKAIANEQGTSNYASMKEVNNVLNFSGGLLRALSINLIDLEYIQLDNSNSFKFVVITNKVSCPEIG